MLSFHLVYLFPPPPFNHSLSSYTLLILLPLVILIFCPLSASSPLLLTIVLLHYHSIFWHAYSPAMIISFLKTLISNYHFKSSPWKKSQFKSHLSTPILIPPPPEPFLHTYSVTDLRTKARRSSVPPSSSFFCPIASQSNESKGNEEGKRGKCSTETSSGFSGDVSHFSSDTKYVCSLLFFFFFTFYHDLAHSSETVYFSVSSLKDSLHSHALSSLINRLTPLHVFWGFKFEWWWTWLGGKQTDQRSLWKQHPM